MDTTQQQLFDDHQGLVVRLVKALCHRLPGDFYDDLMQVGTIALWQTTQRYDAARGHPFSRLASVRVKCSLYDYLRELDPLSRVHRAELKKSGAEPPADVSLEGLLEKAGMAHNFDTLDSRCLPPDQALETREELARVLRGFSARERQLLELYFGRGMSLTEMGHVLGITESAVSIRLKQARTRLAERRGTWMLVTGGRSHARTGTSRSIPPGDGRSHN